MIPTVEHGLINKDPDSFNNKIEQGTISEMIIPAVRGEYYTYSSGFTYEKPLYALMKCKSNKARIIASAEELGREANLFFMFNSSDKAGVCSIKTAQTFGLLGNSVNNELFCETFIALAQITTEDFYKLRSQKDVSRLVEICKTLCSNHHVSVELYPGSVIAMMTDTGKYGMFLVKDIMPNSIQIDACHILL